MLRLKNSPSIGSKSDTVPCCARAVVEPVNRAKRQELHYSVVPVLYVADVGGCFKVDVVSQCIVRFQALLSEVR